MHHRNGGTDQLARINAIASRDATRQHNQASGTLTFRNHFRFVALRFLPSWRYIRPAPEPYSLATFAAIWWAMLTAASTGLPEHAATSMATLLLTVNAR